jgi:fluoride ion exporter CrcB/FEX
MLFVESLANNGVLYRFSIERIISQKIKAKFPFFFFLINIEVGADLR